MRSFIQTSAAAVRFGSATAERPAATSRSIRSVGGLDEALDQPAVGKLHVGVLGGRVGDRAQKRAVDVEHLRRAVEGTAQLGGLVGVALEPGAGGGEHLAREVLDQLQREVVAVAEVDVERRPRQAGPVHHLVDGQVTKRPDAQERLGSAENLALRLLRCPAPAPFGFRGHTFRVVPIGER